jgi:SAM-dependent methyltransferase
MKINTFGLPLELIIKIIIDEVFDTKISTWVDLGCGDGRFISKLKIVPKEGVGIDIVDRNFSCPNFRFEKRNVLEWVNDYKGEPLDLVTMFELIEHLEKDDSISLIKKVQKFANNIIISTPHGFLKQDAETNENLKDNPYQWHRCGFSVEELESLGFFVVILKNVHIRDFGIFDALCAYWGKYDYQVLKRKIAYKNIIYNLNPLNLYRTIRQFAKVIHKNLSLKLKNKK